MPEKPRSTIATGGRGCLKNPEFYSDSLVTRGKGDIRGWIDRKVKEAGPLGGKKTNWRG